MLQIDLSDKIALVTGGARGIGAAIALRLAACGADICILDRKPELAEKISGKIQKEIRKKCMFVCGDVSDPGISEHTIQQILKTFGRLDYAVNNAGVVGKFADIHETEISDFDRVIAINLQGMFYCLKYELAAMVKRHSGAIVNIASVEGHALLSRNAAYTAAKHAVHGLTKTAARDYAPQGIRVNTVSPGVIRTPLSMAGPEITEPLIREIPVGRIGEPDEIANTVAFLLSDLSSYTTGADFVIDGAFLLRG